MNIFFPGKWIDDKSKGRPPKWTNREEPEFYEHYVDDSFDSPWEGTRGCR